MVLRNIVNLKVEYMKLEMVSKKKIEGELKNHRDRENYCLRNGGKVSKIVGHLQEQRRIFLNHRAAVFDFKDFFNLFSESIGFDS